MSDAAADANEADARDREREREDVRFILATKGGRRFLWRMLTTAGLYEATVTGDGIEGAALRDGRRQVGIDLLRWIHDADARGYVAMQSDAIDAAEAREREEAERIAKA